MAHRTDSPRTATIIGAGLAGSYLAILLARLGYRVDIYEKSTLAEILDAANRKSFNLTFYGYGVESFRRIGMWKKVAPTLVKLAGSITQVAQNTEGTFVLFDVDNTPYYTAHRATLLKSVINEATCNPQITYHFNTQVTSINRQEKTMYLKIGTQRALKRVGYDVLIGADGVNSTVRAALQQGQRSSHLQQYPEWNYKQLYFDRTQVKQLGWKTDVMYALTRRDTVLIAFPDRDKSFTALLMVRRDKQPNFDTLTTAQQAHNFVTTWYPELSPVIESVCRDIINNPVGNFVTINSAPWYYRDSMALIGDAAHGFLPFYGMGMTAAFGDCRALAQLITTHNHNWKKILAEYQEMRKKNTDVIAQLSLGSIAQFTRHSRADYASIYDRIEYILHSVAPKLILPPVFFLVTQDPDNAAHVKCLHDRQRRVLNAIGVGLAVNILKYAIRSTELVTAGFDHIQDFIESSRAHRSARVTTVTD